MNRLKLCLKYIIILFTPLFCLKIANIFIVGEYYKTPARLIFVYSILIILLLIIYRWRLKKFELLLPILSIVSILPLCISPQTAIEMMQTPSVIGNYFGLLLNYFWSSRELSYMILTAYLVKLFLEIILNIKDAIESRKETTTEKTEEA